jgi:hypothetical protein
MSSQQQQERTTRSMEYGELDDAALRENKGRVVKGWTVGARLTASPTLTYVSIHSAAETTIVRTAMIEKLRYDSEMEAAQSTQEARPGGSAWATRPTVWLRSPRWVEAYRDATDIRRWQKR